MPSFRIETKNFNTGVTSFIEIKPVSGVMKWTDGSTTRNATTDEIATYNDYNMSLLTNGSTITESATLPPGTFTFMVDASAGAVNLTPHTQGGTYNIVKIDNTSNAVAFKGTVNGLTDMQLINQYANMNVFGSGTTYFLGGNN